VFNCIAACGEELHWGAKCLNIFDMTKLLRTLAIIMMLPKLHHTNYFSMFVNVLWLWIVRIHLMWQNF